MNNVIKILIYLLVALLLVSWLITVGKSCTNNDEGMNETTIERVDRADSARDLMEELEGDTADFSQELESILDEEEAAAAQENKETDFTSYDEPEPEPEPVAVKKPQKKAEPQKATKPVESQTAPQASGPGTFLVVAGSYLIPDNANDQRDKLRSLGYNAEVVSFELSEYHTVLAGRYDDYDRAKSTVNSLAGDGIDSYVKTRSR